MFRSHSQGACLGRSDRRQRKIVADVQEGIWLCINAEGERKEVDGCWRYLPFSLSSPFSCSLCASRSARLWRDRSAHETRSKRRLEFPLCAVGRGEFSIDHPTGRPIRSAGKETCLDVVLGGETQTQKHLMPRKVEPPDATHQFTAPIQTPLGRRIRSQNGKNYFDIIFFVRIFHARHCERASNSRALRKPRARGECVCGCDIDRIIRRCF